MEKIGTINAKNPKVREKESQIIKRQYNRRHSIEYGKRNTTKSLE